MTGTKIKTSLRRGFLVFSPSQHPTHTWHTPYRQIVYGWWLNPISRGADCGFFMPSVWRGQLQQ
jgi:hypothetical protein